MENQNYLNIKSNLRDRLPPVVTINDDPERFIDTLLEMVAWEIHSLGSEYKTSHDYLFEKLKDQVSPKSMKRYTPAHSIMQMYPEKTIELITQDKAVDMEYLKTENNQTAFFAPLQESKMVQAKILYKVINGQIRMQTHPNHSERRPELTGCHTIKKNELYLGLELSPEVKNLDEVILYLDYRTEGIPEEIKSAPFYNLLNIEVNGNKIDFEPFLKPPTVEHITDWHEHHFMVNNIEKPIRNFYNNKFIKLKQVNVLALKGNIPFSESALSEADKNSFKNLCWLKLEFPFRLDAGFIDQATIGINCFPVLNRKLNTRDIHVKNPNPVIALAKRNDHEKGYAQRGEYFLGLQKVFSGFRKYIPAAKEHFKTEESGSYLLKEGRVEPENVQDIRQKVDHLLCLLKNQEEALMTIFKNRDNRNDIIEVLKNLNKYTVLLENKIDSDLRNIPEFYIQLNTSQVRENVIANFWTTQGPELRGSTKNNVLPFEHNHQDQMGRFSLISVVK